jgi:hypothetical protein
MLQDGQTIDGPEFTERWLAFRELGCTYETANQKYLSIDLPPNTDVSRVYSLLNDGEKEGVWVFEEGYYAEQQQ